ncbi:MAG TPA: DUF262 domain-containing protein [Flavobacterium sp.]|jgi:hypothetical protein
MGDDALKKVADEHLINLFSSNIDEDVEPELDNDDVVIIEPFDPNAINIKIIPFTIGQLIDKLSYEEIKIPEYQRKAGLWDIKRKSRFIESLILRLPIPLFYFDERELDIWWVVDGLQRVTTIKEFIIDKAFKLQNLEFLKNLDDYDWDTLERKYQRNINQSQITINLIQKGTPEKVKHNIFRRINQGSIELSAQELRTALLWGFRTNFLKQLVSSSTNEGKAFLKVTDYRVKNDRQEDLDFASRFVAFYLIDYKSYEPDMDNFLTDGTLKIPEDVKEQNIIKKKFLQSMNLAYDIFGTDAFRKRKDFSEPRKPINKPLFEALAVAFAHLNGKGILNLLNHKDSFKTDLISAQNTDFTFWSSISTGTAAKDRVIKRNNTIRDLVSKYSNDSTFRD